MHMPKVLVIDDEKRIVDGVKKYYEQAGFNVLAAYDGDQGFNLAIQEEPDLVVLDLMLPGMDGLDVCRKIRQRSDVPIIMLTARVEETDKLIGLELGADDYVTKPFSPRELVARSRAVLRRMHKNGEFLNQGAVSEIVHIGEIVFDVGAHQCQVNGEVIQLTPIEYDLLTYMVRHKKQVCTRMQLLQAAHLGSYEGVERTIDVHMYNLRKKLEEDPTNPKYILTVFGVGYRLTDGA
ncbi:MAG: response regulator transcription factor [Anaerolineaceae bacterium]|nr:response regulator transcription factor [Anaerolineaceae bacterium]